MRVIYVAGPFRGPSSWAIERNVREAEELGFEVAARGAMPLIPHTNTRYFQGELTDAFWLEGTLELLRRCDGLILTPRWRSSSGACAEVLDAFERKQPIFGPGEYGLQNLAKWLRAGFAPGGLDRLSADLADQARWTLAQKRGSAVSSPL